MNTMDESWYRSRIHFVPGEEKGLPVSTYDCCVSKLLLAYVENNIMQKGISIS